MSTECEHLEGDYCDRCYGDPAVGQHGIGLCAFQPRRGHAVIGDDVPGGFTVENGFATPQTFYSKKAHREALAREGNMLCDWNRGDHDKVCPRWDSVDLEAARALVSRQQKATKDVPEAPPALVKAFKDVFYR